VLAFIEPGSILKAAPRTAARGNTGKSTERAIALDFFFVAARRRDQSSGARSDLPRACVPQLTKEIVMNEELQTELEIVELGDAKEETKGSPVPTAFLEDGSDIFYRQGD
jgi:hypothetical protein